MIRETTGTARAEQAAGARTEPQPADERAVRLERIGLLTATGVGAYVSALNQSTVNAILPLLTDAFGTDVASVEWVITVYMLVLSGLLLSFGRLGDLHGYKRVYQSGFAIFIVGSALCGLAPTVPLLVAARALQALGAAMLISIAPALLTRGFPAQLRGRVLGFYGTMVYLGLATGAPLGGWVATVWSWRVVFWLAVPVGLVALLLSWRIIRADSPRSRQERFDVAGAATYLLGLVAVLLALNQGHAWGWLSAGVLGSLVLGLALLAVFAALELRVASPMLDLRLFQNRAFTAPVLSAVFNYMGVSSTFFLLPFYLIQGRGLSPASAGLVLTAQPIVMAITATLAGALSDRIGTRIPTTTGMGILAFGLFLLSRIGETTPFTLVAAVLGLIGLGIGLFTSPNNSAVMGAVPSQRRGVASGVLATARTLGNVLGIGMAGAIFNTVLHGAEGQAAVVVEAVGAGLVAASLVALLGALTSATRPRVQA